MARTMDLRGVRVNTVPGKDPTERLSPFPESCHGAEACPTVFLPEATMRFASIIVIVLLSLVAVLFLLRDLPPPERLLFAAGQAGSGYFDVAEQYRQILSRDGIEVEIVQTAGSVENVDLLGKHEVDVALIQGGIATGETDAVGLGTVFAEPLLIFLRTDRSVHSNPAFWQGVRIAWGVEGSGSRTAIQGLLERLELGAPVNVPIDIGGTAAVEALLAGDIEVAAFVAPFEAQYLAPLFNAPQARLLSPTNAEAVSLRLPHSDVATVPPGALSLNPVIPPVPLDILTLPARLAAVPDLHPAVVDRLVMAAREIHGERTILSREGEFPTTMGVDMPIDSGALKLLLEGQSAFHGWLPYWVAAQIRQVLLILVPLLFIVVPLIRSLPFAYSWSMRRRVWRHYRHVREIEQDVAGARDADALERLERQLLDLDDRLAGMRLPGAFRDRAYDLRLHIELVRRRIRMRLEEFAKVSA